MRKLLLATAAVLGAGIFGTAETAQAQTATTAAAPAPGTVTVRLNGRFRFFAAYINDSDAQNNLQGGNGTTPLTGTNKLANYDFIEYARLYPGFDGVAANGLKYGASLEIRQDHNGGAGGGTFGSISVQDQTRGELYFRREWGYIGTDKLGTIRFGNTDPASSLYMTGNFENFNDGGINGDVYNAIPANLQIAWPFADVGNLYDTSKILYLSPQFFGFDFGVSFEPNSGNVNENSGCGGNSFTNTNFINPAGTATTAAGVNAQSIAGPGCNALSSTPTGDYTRRRNTFDGLIRYRGSFGPVGIAATAGYIGGSHVDNNSTVAPGAIPPTQYNGLKVGDFGLAVTYGGLSVGGKYQFGRYNGQWSLDPTRVTVAPGVTRDGPDAVAWLVGASYTLGPVIVGFHYLDYTSTGDLTQGVQGRQRREQGLSAGGTYSLAPGLSIFLDYLYEQRKQNGFNFITGATNDFVNHNKVTAQLISLGTSFAW